MSLALGIDIGGTKTAVGVVDESGRVLARADAQTPAREGGARIVTAAAELAARISAGYEVSAAGVGAAGVIDAAERRVVSATGSLTDWAGTELGELLQHAIGVPVVTINDVHAHAIGEGFTGAGAGASTVLLAAVGTGIGGAVLIDGKLHIGARSVAGHLGHVPVAEAAGLACPCGKVGHLEAISSGRALHELYIRLGGATSARDSRDVIERADRDELARAAVTTSAAALGHALGGLVNVIDPDVVIIAGGMRMAGTLWWSTMDSALRQSALPLMNNVRVVHARLGDDAAIIGAARLAIETTESHP